MPVWRMGVGPTISTFFVVFYSSQVMGEHDVVSPICRGRTYQMRNSDKTISFQYHTTVHAWSATECAVKCKKWFGTCIEAYYDDEANQCYLTQGENDMKKHTSMNTVILQQIATSCVVPKTCKEWFDQQGKLTSGHYIIHPDGRSDGESPVQVECKTNNKGQPITMFHHNTESQTHAGDASAPYSGVYRISYDAPLSQIVNVMKLSSQCTQWIKYKCKHARISNFTTWYSRDGVPMYYWGGAEPGSRKCACGMDNSCAGGVSAACNCDINNDDLYYDQGYLSDKTTLPVSKLAFGDLSDSNEEGYFTLRPLICI